MFFSLVAGVTCRCHAARCKSRRARVYLLVVIAWRCAAYFLFLHENHL